MAWIISIILNASGLVANWLYGNKSRLGPALWAGVAIAWIVYFLATEQPALCVGPALNLLSQIRNLVKWSKEGKR